MNISSRERVLRALAHEEPDRVPYNLRPSDEMKKRLQEERCDPNIDFADFFGHDIRYVTIPLPERPKHVPEQDWLPRPTEEAISKCVRESQSLRDRGLAVCSAYACGVFEQAKHWFGDEQTLTLPFENPSRLERELKKITEWKMDVYAAYVRAGVDIVWIGDDLGMQQNLIMSPEQYRQWYRPCHHRIVQYLKEVCADCLSLLWVCHYAHPGPHRNRNRHTGSCAGRMYGHRPAETGIWYGYFFLGGGWSTECSGAHNPTTSD